MSHLTEIVMQTSAIDDENVVDRFNAELGRLLGITPTSNTWMLLQPLNTEGLSGPKFFTNHVWASCWNNRSGYIPVLVELFQGFDWEHTEDAVLTVSDEGSGTKVYRPHGHE